MPNSDTDQESDSTSQEDADIESQEDSQELPDDPEKLKELLRVERAKKQRVVKDNQALRTRLNGNKSTTTSKKNEAVIPPALVARAQKASFLEAISSVNVLDRDLLWLAARDLLEFDENYDPVNVSDVLTTLKQKHAKLFGTRGSADSRGSGRSIGGQTSSDSFRDLINAARGGTIIGGLGE